MALVDSEAVLYNDGEGLIHTDLNDAGAVAQQRAWEWPGYMDLFPQAMFFGATYDASLTVAADLNQKVFTKGGSGSLTASGLAVTIAGGFFGIYSAAAPPAAMAANMRWVYLDGTQSFTFSAAPAGQERYDVIQLQIVSQDGGAVSRDFKDATTGALSSASLNKRRKLVGTFSVKVGVAATAGSAPDVSLQTLTSPNHYVALVRVSDTAVTLVQDLTMPLGPCQTHMSVPAKHSLPFGAWAASSGGYGGMKSGAGGDPIYVFPPALMGDPTARLLGIDISYELAATSVVEINSIMPGDSATGFFQQLDVITSLFTLGSPQVARIKLLGFSNVTVANQGPYWGHGDRVKAGILSPGSFNRGLALKVVSASNADRINWVKWHFAKG